MRARAMAGFGMAMALAMAAGASARAQAPEASMHQRLLSQALENLGKARCGREPCAPATAEERANPPLTDEQARQIVATGTVSVMAEHCQLDWQRRNFVPMMRFHREELKMSERQMALVGLLHGITMGTFQASVRQQPCTPNLKETTEKRLIAR